MANGGINFFIVIYRFSLVKVAMNAPRISKLRKNCVTDIDQCAIVLSKHLTFFVFQPIAKGGTKTTAHLPIADGFSF